MAEQAENQEKQLQQEAQGVELNEFEALLQKNFKPKSDEMSSAVKNAVQTLAQQALEETSLISDDAIDTIEKIIAVIDEKISHQVNQIMHHPDFQELESTWRGLSYLVNNTETDESLKIRVLNLPKNEAAKQVKKYKGVSWDQSPLFKKIYEEEFGSPGGEPYGCLVADYMFDHTPSNLNLLQGMAKIASAAHAPMLTSPSPSLLNMDSWQELSNPRDLTKIFQTGDYASWRSFRDSEDSRYVCMAMPRFLSRLPYGADTNPVEEFAFEEDTDGKDHSKYLWSNAAYAMATNITRAFKNYGWCSKIRGVESGGIVEELPCHTFPTDDGGVDMKCPTEIAITDRREAELSKNGFMSLCHWKNQDYAAFIGAQTLHKPAEYDDPDATANDNLASRLPYLFAVCRFAHYLKTIVRDKIGSFKEREDMQNWLNDWITKYVCTDPNASEEVKAQYPLASAEVKVEDIEGNPGYYSAKFYLRPHYQLEGLSTSLRLVSKLPSAKNS
ncbi:type VI secretion system contractile sheath large subunit [Sedimentisphaera salicampi]|uniref:Type VI secretion protein, EvpB/ family n=1 Tax=Sedimentisphaera salicampi TaxID=1941349 RepID=A0A1W6LMH2_9BACT|nr:type VI secretion system contractile sheath large subunit [Sedimentisphaera salicampi]ARN56933.1 type VI secretion protein, EvpB/ family [Sedimentisphaera salicampi]